jgi:hypothetical protein
MGGHQVEVNLFFDAIVAHSRCKNHCFLTTLRKQEKTGMREPVENGSVL